MSETDRRKQASELYIPLCFYFNWNPRRICFCSSRLYIPLCFYFNSKFPQSYCAVCILYIPLCFYFNAYRSFTSFNVFLSLHSTMFLFQFCSNAVCILCYTAFTFHYVSISIWFYQVFIADMPTFTFHYVSISIILRLLIIKSVVNFTFHYVSISM